MSNDLTILATHRNELLLAEVAAWLHDDFKHTDAQIHQYVIGAPPPSGRQNTDDLVPARQVTLLGQTLSFSDVKKRRQLDFVTGYLNRCHYTAHIEKQDGDGPQTYPAFLSSPFGYESTQSQIPTNLTMDLRSRLSWHLLARYPFTGQERTRMAQEITSLFSQVGGDTRRPANEITLWEWGHTVGAFYKAALVGALLGYQPQPNDLRWRLLSIRFDGLSFVASVSNLPDLLARRIVLENALNRIRHLLEEEYPLGTEVYRDENGSIYLVPGCEKARCPLDLMVLQDSTKTSLKTLIDLAAEGAHLLDLKKEMVPTIRPDADPWWGQDPVRAGNDELPPVADHVGTVVSSADPDWLKDQWLSGLARDICPVCGVRPQGDPKSQDKDERKAGERKVCEVCERRRDDRAKAWVANLGASTIWLDEVADLNGRTVLLVGQFDLSQWLMGDRVRTLTVNDPYRSPGQTTQDIGKNPSFSRLRRVWETTHQFWQEVLPTDPNQDLQHSLIVQAVGQGGHRLTLQGVTRSAEREGTLGRFHVYELTLANGVRLSVVWDPDQQRFITADNLAYIASVLGEEVPAKEPEESFARFQRRVSSWAAEKVMPHLVGELTIEEPTGYGAANTVWGQIVVTQDGIGRTVGAEGEGIAYPPIIPILAEPSTFMALIPARPALAVVQAIKEKYEREMGKVRNRLPLTLGVVYAGRRQPLASVLDAGRRMLRRQPQAVQAVVQAVSPVNPWPQQVELTLKVGERAIPVVVPTVMGDATTADVWYPYWQVAGKPRDRQRWFIGSDGEHWVHVCDLRAGDQVAFTPSTFDFEYLDTSARRFEVAYGEDGQRRGTDKRQRPYLLEQVADLEGAWAQVSRASTAQVKALESLIEAKRRDWGEPTGTPKVSATFRQFVADALREAGVHTGSLEKAAVTGLLADALELHLTIHKEKLP